MAWLLSKRPEAVLYDKVGRGSVSHLCRSSVAPFLGDACDGWGADFLRRIATKRRREEFARKDLSEIRQYIPVETRGYEGLPLMNSVVYDLIIRRS